MRYLRKIANKTRCDRIRNTTIRNQLNITPVETIIEKRQLSWLGHLQTMCDGTTTKRIFEARVHGNTKVWLPREKDGKNNYIEVKRTTQDRRL